MTSAQVDIPNSILKEAAGWLVRTQVKPLTATEQQRLQDWRNKNHFHELAWTRAEQLGLTIQQIPSEIGMQVLGRPASADRRKFTKHLVALLTVAPASMLAYQYAPWQQAVAEFKTAKGEQKSYQLADGSQLMLNTDSAADIVFNQHQRLVQLHKGEIYIVTAHDAEQRPFLVKTTEGQLHAIGTKFVVRKQSAESYLGVIESAVDISLKENPEQHKVIHAGQQTTFSATHIHQSSVLDNNADAWVNGIIYADNMPLETFINILMRYRTGVIQCDASCKGISVSGVFQLDNPDNILQVLEQTRPVHIEWRTRYWAMITKKEKPTENK